MVMAAFEARVGLALAAVCVLVAVYRLHLFNQLGGPTGSDPGNWLAIAKEIFGQRIKAAVVPYPPLIPLILRGLLAFFPPLVALSILGSFASVAVIPAVYPWLRAHAGPFWALALASASAFLSFQVELLAWGGYPQLIGNAVVLASMYLLARGVAEERHSLMLVIFSAALASVGVGTSSFVILHVLAGVPLLLVVLVWRRFASLNRVFCFFAIWSGFTAIFSLPYVPVYLTTVRLAAGRVWNPRDVTVSSSHEVFEWLFREWPGRDQAMLAWLGLASAMTVYLLTSRAGRSVLASVSTSLMISSIFLFFVTLEPRVLGIFQLGMLGGATAVFCGFWERCNGWHRSYMRRVARATVQVVALLVAVLLVTQGHQRTLAAFAWFRVLDPSVLKALTWVEENVGPRLIVASDGPRDARYGWWIEGLSGSRAYMAIDPRFLNFRQEREQAQIANALVRSTSPRDISDLAERHGVDYLFLDRSLHADLSRFFAGGFVPVFLNDKIAILYRIASLAADPPSWWPSAGLRDQNALDVNPPPPRAEDSRYGGYYILWYVKARKSLEFVLGSQEDESGSLIRDATKRPLLELWRDIRDLKLAMRSGVVGDPRFPGYHYRLWQAFGRPRTWPDFELPCKEMIAIVPPTPPLGVETEPMKRWYACNRAELAVVYTGRRDASISAHLVWARRFDDLSLYQEIMLMRQAFREGVVGSPERPFDAFKRWRRSKGL
jgi:hypothetical protein